MACEGTQVLGDVVGVLPQLLDPRVVRVPGLFEEASVVIPKGRETRRLEDDYLVALVDEPPSSSRFRMAHRRGISSIP